jgi:hypothetical protein
MAVAKTGRETAFRGPLLDIIASSNISVGRNKKTPAMRLRLAAARLTARDLASFMC